MQIDEQQIIGKLTSLGQHNKPPKSNRNSPTRSTPTSTPDLLDKLGSTSPTCSAEPPATAGIIGL